MPKQVTLNEMGWQVTQGMQPGPEGPVPVTLLVLADPADGTTYIIPWSDDAKRQLVAALTGGIVLAPSNGNHAG